jgi:hypothetical protein
VKQSRNEVKDAAKEVKGKARANSSVEGSTHANTNATTHANDNSAVISGDHSSSSQAKIKH